MRVLLDESLPRQLVAELAPVEVVTVQAQGWSSLQNGALLRRAAAAGFEVFLTADQGIEFQQNLRGLGIGVVIVRARSNRMQHLLLLVEEIGTALLTVTKGNFVRVGG